MFLLVATYPESTDFSSPLAAGQKFPVGLQVPPRSSVENAGPSSNKPYADGELQVVAPDGSDVAVAEVEPGRFETVLTSEGDHTLRASFGGTEDTIKVRVAKQASFRLSTHATIHTNDPARSCTEPLSPGQPLPVLRRNQFLSTHLVALDANGTPMLGVVEATAAPSKLAVRTQGNLVWIDVPDTTMETGQAPLLLTDLVTGQQYSTKVDFDGSTDAICP